MSPKAIVEVWEYTKSIFNKFNISLSSKKALETLVTKDILPILLTELNNSVGSTRATCIEGGLHLPSK
jgi:hypothetical protein